MLHKLALIALFGMLLLPMHSHAQNAPDAAGSEFQEFSTYYTLHKKVAQYACEGSKLKCRSEEGQYFARELTAYLTYKDLTVWHLPLNTMERVGEECVEAPNSRPTEFCKQTMKLYTDATHETVQMTPIMDYLVKQEKKAPGFEPDPTFNSESPQVKFAVFFTVFDTLFREGLNQQIVKMCDSFGDAECDTAAMTDKIIAYLTYRMTDEKSFKDAVLLRDCANGRAEKSQCEPLIIYTHKLGEEYGYSMAKYYKNKKNTDNHVIKS